MNAEPVVARAAGEPPGGTIEGGPSSALDVVGEWLSGYPDSSLLRFLHRLPIPLWRLGLGFLLGSDLMILTTRGVKSGLPRSTGLAAHRVEGRLYAWCPYGDRALWFRNLAADPRVTIQTASRCEAASARRIESVVEAKAVYEHLRLFDARMLHSYLVAEGIADDPAAFVAARRRLHVVRFDSTAAPGPGGVGKDLAWIWPALAAVAGVVLLRVRTRRHSRA